MSEKTLLVEPVPALERLSRYSVGRPDFETDLILDFNESLDPLPLSGSVPDVPRANLYPWTAPLEGQLAEKIAVGAEQVIVTCGADDALERAVRSVCCPGRRALLMNPTYGMPQRYAVASGADIATVPWEDESFPVERVCNAAGDHTALLYLVSPNNPTGSVITRTEFADIVRRLPTTLILHDQAYREFSDPVFDLTEIALDHPNVVLVRTFSKAWGGAGLRAGYGVGDARVIDWMRRIGQPFAVSRPTLEILETVVASGAEPSRARIDRVRLERNRLSELLTELGAEPLPSQASFVAARFADAPWVRIAMASLGIAIRGFPGRAGLDDLLRTTLPGDDLAFERLTGAFRTVLQPKAVFIESDESPHHFAQLPPDPERLRSFGSDPSPAVLEFDQLPTRHAWLVGRTPEGIRAARAASLLPFGWASSEDQAAALIVAGAARVIASLDEIADLVSGSP